MRFLHFLSKSIMERMARHTCDIRFYVLILDGLVMGWALFGWTDGSAVWGAIYTFHCVEFRLIDL